ncbi:MAG: asparagine synthase (glutamine-hydrolyzing) [Thermodesulfovibrio sp.]|nr:asparagine synthase (glutamine-hydrolyzing) [Thermodesulfovibrio sp.]
MCGIVGYIGLDNQEPIDGELFVKMVDSLSHRGPDGEGFYFSGSFNKNFIDKLKESRPNAIINFQNGGRTVALGHRRLAIIDLSPQAGQPMSDAERKIWIVFNGEIYNHREIRKQLENKYHFRTNHSDTECIIYAYKEWGKEFVNRLRGMFAIVIWDAQNDRLIAYRDRAGIKPLYYMMYNGRFYFASEIKALLQDRNFDRRINTIGLYHYLSFLVVPAPDTLFKDIYKLKAGHMIEIEKGTLKEQQEYWDVFDNTRKFENNDERQIADELLNHLEESVRYHLESDVPIGVFLSGGVDSSTIAALSSKILKRDVYGFSIGYKDDRKLTSYKNEFIYAEKVANIFNINYKPIEISQEDFLNFIHKLNYHQDEPIADPVCVPVFYLARFAKDNGVSVIQVGEGSDELFCGYEWWLRILSLQELDDRTDLKSLKLIAFSIAKLFREFKPRAYEYLRRSISGERIFWSGAEAFSEAEKHLMLSDELKQELKGLSSYEIIKWYHAKFLMRASDKSNLNWMSYIDLKIRLPELLLMRVDKMTMAASVEARVPFLDHKFIEYSMSIPSYLKYKSNQTKYILKKAVENILPKEIVYRKKQGFGTPVFDWFFDKLGSFAREEINRFNKQTNFFSKSFLDYLYTNAEGNKVWYILNLASWWEEWINKNKTEL